jgi:CRP/FNR family cyclic AMP-dependent transcriptional regulator
LPGQEGFACTPGLVGITFRPMARRDAFIDHLQQVPLFAACSRKDLQLVARRAEDVRVPPGKTLVSEGETGHEFFVILDGEARVTRQGRKVATIGPGAAFGELALLEKAPRNATVIADTDMELVVLGQREFAGLIDEVPGFARKLLAGMAHRLREADARSVQ